MNVSNEEGLIRHKPQFERMQTDEEFMRETVKEAGKSLDKLQCATIIVLNEEIIGKAFNLQRTDNDITAHAELKALRMAGKVIGSKNMQGATVYSTHEPCLMCLTAIAFAKCSRLVFSIPYKTYSPDEQIMFTAKAFVQKFGLDLKVEDKNPNEEKQ